MKLRHPLYGGPRAQERARDIDSHYSAEPLETDIFQSLVVLKDSDVVDNRGERPGRLIESSEESLDVLLILTSA